MYCIFTCNGLFGLFDTCKQIDIFIKIYLEMSLSYSIASLRDALCPIVSILSDFWSESVTSIITTVHR